MNDLPNDYFIGYHYKIGKTRKQKYPNCWALTIISCIEDIFCIDNRIKPINLSLYQLMLLANDACNNSKKLYNTRDNCLYKINAGFNMFLISDYLERNNYGLKLSQCLNEKEVLGYLYNTEKGNFISKDDLKTNYIAKDINTICEGCLSKNECIKKDDLIQNFNITIKKYTLYQYMKMNKTHYTKNDIKNIQNMIKSVIFDNKPIASSIIVTYEYGTFFQNKTSEYFIPTIDTDKNIAFEHAIVILGWENKNGKEYWIIRDTNFPDRFLKIAFSTFSDKNKWLFLDIKWGDNLKRNSIMSFDVKGNYGNKKFSDYIEQNIFEKVNYKSEL